MLFRSLGGYGEWKRFIGSVDINFYIPNAKRKEGIPNDNYKYGHIAKIFFHLFLLKQTKNYQ